MVARQILTLKIEVRVLAGEIDKVNMRMTGFTLIRIIKLSLLSSLLYGCAVSKSSNTQEQFKAQVHNSERRMMDDELERTSQAIHHYLLGQLQYDKQEFEGALKHFESASRLIDSPAPHLHGKLAELFLRSGDLEKALSEVEKAKQQNPDDINISLLHAGVLETMERYEEAEPIYRQLIKANPDSLDAYLLLSSLYLKKGEYSSAERILAEFVKSNPSEIIALTMLARVYELNSNLVKAEKYMKQALKIEPKNHILALELLRILVKQQKLSESQELCNRILEQAPDNVVARKILGQLLLGESKFDEALEHFQVLENIESDANDTRFKIALIQIGRQNFKDAITQLNLVLVADPSYPEARYYLASTYVASGRKKEAVEELLKIEVNDKMYIQSRLLASFILRQEKNLTAAESAIAEAFKASPEDIGVVSYYSLILREGNKLKEAKKLLKAAAEKHGDNDRILFHFAVVLAELQEKAEAMKVLERVVDVNPKHTDALNFLAYELAEAGQELDRAEKLVKAALEIKPQDGYYLDTLGWIYFKKGNYSDAVEVLSRAVILSGEDPVILEHYARALLKAGDEEKALMQYKIGATRSFDLSSSENRKAVERMRKKYKELNDRH